MYRKTSLQTFIMCYIEGMVPSLAVSCCVALVLCFARVPGDLFILIIISAFILLSILFFFIMDSENCDQDRWDIDKFIKKNERIQHIIDANIHESAVSALKNNYRLKVYFTDFEFFITKFIRYSNIAYDANKIHELDNQIHESYVTVTNLLLSNGVKSVLNGYAKDFKHDVLNIAAALTKKHRDIAYDLALEAQNAVNNREKDKNCRAEQEAVSIIQNSEYKKLVQKDK